MQLNPQHAVFLGIGFLGVTISLIIAFNALIKKRKISYTHAWEDFLKQDSFSHFDVAQFARNTLKEEVSFSSLHSKLLKPLVKEGKLKEEIHTIPIGKYPRKVLIYRKLS